MQTKDELSRGTSAPPPLGLQPAQMPMSLATYHGSSCWGGPDKEALLTNMEINISAGLVGDVRAEVAT